MEKLTKNTNNLLIEKLKLFMPEFVEDGKFDKEKLLNALSEIEDSSEKYKFSWPGKNLSIRYALQPSECTLVPCEEKSVKWEETENIYIEGDNLEVLKTLQKTYYKKVKFIYIDPPYNTGTDFVYKDDFKNSHKNYLEITNQHNRANPETNGRYHTDWLNMIYPRLYLASNFLTDDGIIAISIDDHEVNNLKFVCDEIFGEDNCLGLLPRITKKSGKAHADGFAKNHDYILLYCKNIYECEINGLDSDSSDFSNEDEYVDKRGKYKLNQTLDYDSLWYNPTMDFPIEVDGMKYVPGGSMDKHKERHNGIHNPKDWVWRWSKAKFDFGYANGFVVIKPGKDRPRIYTKTYLNAKISKDANGKYFIEYFSRENNVSSLNFVENVYSNDNAKKELSAIMDPSLFDFPKPVSLIKSLIQLVDTKNMIVMDFFSGSGTTAQAVLDLNKDGKNRKFVLVQLPELLKDDSKAKKELGLNNLCDLGQYRIKKYLDTQTSDYNLFSDTITQGFKVFKLESTNIRPWDGSIKLDEYSLLDFNETVKEGRSNLDVAYEIMLRYGVFNMQLRIKKINDKEIYSIGEDYLIICLENNISMNDVSQIANLKPHCVVFKETGFNDDNDKINATYTLERLGVEDVKCI